MRIDSLTELFWHHPPIGLDIGARTIKAAQIARTADAPPLLARLARTGKGSRVTPEEVDRLKDSLRRQGFHGRRAVICLPWWASISSVITLPPKTSGAPIETIGRIELARNNKLDPAEMEFGMWETPTPERSQAGCEVMAVGLRHRDAAEILAPFEACGVEVCAIDAWPCAMERLAAAARARLDERPGMEAIVDVGWEATRLALLCDGTVIYQRVMNEVGLTDVVAAMVRELGIDDPTAQLLLERSGDVAPVCGADESTGTAIEQAKEIVRDFGARIAADIEASFSYGSRRLRAGAGRPVAWICGGGAAHRSLLNGVEAGVAGRVERMHCAASIGCRLDHPLADDPGLTLAVALATHTGEESR